MSVTWFADVCPTAYARTFTQKFDFQKGGFGVKPKIGDKLLLKFALCRVPFNCTAPSEKFENMWTISQELINGDPDESTPQGLEKKDRQLMRKWLETFQIAMCDHINGSQKLLLGKEGYSIVSTDIVRQSEEYPPSMSFKMKMDDQKRLSDTKFLIWKDEGGCHLCIVYVFR